MSDPFFWDVFLRNAISIRTHTIKIQDRRMPLRVNLARLEASGNVGKRCGHSLDLLKQALQGIRLREQGEGITIIVMSKRGRFTGVWEGTRKGLHL